jgi:ketosteroid isomerase-like protein
MLKLIQMAMKKFILIILVVSAFTVSAQRKKPKHIKQQVPDKTLILQLLINQKNAWNEGNLEQYMMGYWKSDSLSFIGKKGVTKGWQATLDNYKKSYPDKESMGQLDFEILKVEILSPTHAYVVGKWNLTRKEKGNIGGHFSLLLKKSGKRWVIVSDHSS